MDLTIFDTTPAADDPVRCAMAEGLERYAGLFSALASMVYLPAFVLDQGARVAETTFATRLRAESTSRNVRDAIKILGRSQVPFFRTVRCLVGNPPSAEEAARTVHPPEMSFRSSGYWRPLGPGEIGEAKDGTPIVGKTWVERTESWSSPDSPIFQHAEKPASGSRR